jgi:hypothetical protein
VQIDELARVRLQTLSGKRKIWFVVGLIDPGTDEASGYNSAYLIDGATAPLLLSRKRCPGGPLYSPYLADVDQPVRFRGIGLAARVCEDATENGPDVAPLLQRLQDLNCERNLLCIPAYMGTYSSEGVAARCAQLKLRGSASMVVALANGCLSHPSVIARDRQEFLSDSLHKDQIGPLCNF